MSSTPSPLRRQKERAVQMLESEMDILKQEIDKQEEIIKATKQAAMSFAKATDMLEQVEKRLAKYTQQMKDVKAGNKAAIEKALY